MTIDEMITHLQSLRDNFGDLPVVILTDDRCAYEHSFAEVLHVSPHHSIEDAWVHADEETELHKVVNIF